MARLLMFLFVGTLMIGCVNTYQPYGFYGGYNGTQFGQGYGYTKGESTSAYTPFGSTEDTIEIDFLNCNGEWSVYIDPTHDFNIYSWSGTPLAYIDKNLNIYGFNGDYLGWLEGQIMYDVDGEPFACTANAYNGYTPYKPYKGYKEYAPYKSYPEYPQYRPYKTSYFSGIDAEIYLSKGIR